MSNLPALPEHSPLRTLETWEDFLAFYQRLDEVEHNVSWVKADLLLTLQEKFGGNSLESFAGQVKVPFSTVVNYVRTARAFPPDTRISFLPFSSHMEASYADQFDEQTKDFKSAKRFEWIDKAAIDEMPARQLKFEIQRDKRREELNVTVVPCAFCARDDGTILSYKFYAPYSGLKGDQFELHQECYEKVVAGLYRRVEAIWQNRKVKSSPSNQQ